MSSPGSISHISVPIPVLLSVLLSLLLLMVCCGGALYRTQNAEQQQISNIQKLNAVEKDELPIKKATGGNKNKSGSLPVKPPPFLSVIPDDICKAAEINFRSASGVFAIITGLEHSGTTITSSLIMSAPNLFGVFECSLLKADTPSKF